VAAHVLTGKGKHGFDDRHRGQLMVLTGMNVVTYGPVLCLELISGQDPCSLQGMSLQLQPARLWVIPH
jgi:hypothetical protein